MYISENNRYGRGNDVKASRVGSTWSLGRLVVSALALAVGLLSAQPLAAQVEAVVATSASTLASGLGGYGPTAMDACGNVYVNTGNGVFEYAAGTGAKTTVQAGSNYLKPIYMDYAKQNLYFSDQTSDYTNHFVQVPITNCAPGAVNANFANNLGSITAYYIQGPNTITGDMAGDVFFTPGTSNNGFTPGSIIEISVSGTYSLALQWPNTITSMAASPGGTIYFTDGSNNIYQVPPPYPGAKTTPAPTIVASGFLSIVSLGFDTLGNLYIVDSNGYNGNIYYSTTLSAILYEVPQEGTGTTAALNFAHRYIVANGLGIAAQPGIGTSSFAYTSYPPGNLQNVTVLARDNFQLATTAVGSSATTVVNYVFNASATPTSFSPVQGTAASSIFTNSSTTCVAGTTYTAGQGCSVTVKFTPATPGVQTGATVLANAAKTTLSTATLSGIGLAPAITIDPGTLTTVSSVLKAPTGATIDNRGNLFVTDATAGTLTEYVGGTGTGVAISTGSLTLSGPQGVAVDSVGNIFIADTGNSRVVEIPVINGVLTNASALVVPLSLSRPQAVAVDAENDLLIADLLNKSLIFVPSYSGSLNLNAVVYYPVSSTGASAIALDSAGDVFVGESTAKDVLEFPAPLGGNAAVKVVSGIVPTALAADASGSLFVVDSVSANAYRYPNNAGIFGTRAIVSNGVASPAGIAIDSTGNLYITDATNSVVDKLARVQASVLFGVVNVTSTSSPATAVVSASGNQPVTFPTPSYSVSGNTTAGFAVTSDGCGSAATLAVGSACSIVATFTPPMIEVNAEEDLTLKGNATTGTPKIALIGTGQILRPTTVSLVLTTPASGSISAGQAVSFTATIGTGGATFVPGGSVKFSVNGTQVATVKVTNGSAVLSLPNGLPAGLATILAVYTGDSVNYGGSSQTLTEIVLALPTTLTLAFQGGTGTTIYNNPYSTNDASTSAQGPAIVVVASLNGIGTTIPAGTISFYSAGSTTPTLLGTASVNVNGVASITTNALRSGTTNVVENNSFASTYNVYAVYSGDTTYATSTTPSTPITIVAPPVCALGTSPTCPNTQPTGANFSLTPATLNITVPYTLGGQQTGTATLTGISYGGWTGLLTFTCTGLPAYATCNPYPGVPQLNASTVAAPQAQAQVLFSIRTNVLPPSTTIAGLVWWIAGLTGLGLLLVRGRVKGGLRHGLTLAGLALLLAGSSATMTACSGGTSYVTTPKGTSTVTVKVNAAQLNVSASATAGAVYPNDVNTPTFQVLLTVQ